MVGMLVFNQTWREHDTRTNTTNHFRQPDGVRGANFQMRVAVQFEKFDRGAEQRGGFFRFGSPLFWSSVRAGFAARTHDKMGLAAGQGFPRDDPAAAEFDVVGMRAKRQQRLERRAPSRLVPVRL